MAIVCQNVGCKCVLPSTFLTPQRGHAVSCVRFGSAHTHATIGCNFIQLIRFCVILCNLKEIIEKNNLEKKIICEKVKKKLVKQILNENSYFLPLQTNALDCLAADVEAPPPPSVDVNNNSATYRHQRQMQQLLQRHVFSPLQLQQLMKHQHALYVPPQHASKSFNLFIGKFLTFFC